MTTKKDRIMAEGHRLPRRARRPALALPTQAEAVDRSEPSATSAAAGGVEADLWGLPVGDWLEAPGQYAWNAAKGWLNS
jgi:hypothetical protein